MYVINMYTYLITNVSTPVLTNDAADKLYVDSQIEHVTDELNKVEKKIAKRSTLPKN